MKILNYTIRRPDFMLSEQDRQARRAREQQRSEPASGSMLVSRRRSGTSGSASSPQALAGKKDEATSASIAPRLASLAGGSGTSKPHLPKALADAFTPDSPVQNVPQQEISKVIRQFLQQIRDWQKDAEPLEDSSDQEVMRWVERLDETCDIASAMARAARSPHNGDRHLAYFVDSVPAALATFREVAHSSKGESAHIEVEYLAAHPGSKRAGGTLMESVVNYAEAFGAKGRVKLLSENDDSTAAYQAMGFGPSTHANQAIGDAQIMYLDPTLSSKWIRSGSQWQLRSNGSSQYLDTIGRVGGP